MRDATIRVERFRDEHDRRHEAKHGPSQHVDIAGDRRFYIDGMEKELERQRKESDRTGYVPDDLLGDELMPELVRLHEEFPNITLVHGEPRPWHLDISDDAQPELFEEIEEITVLVPASRDRTSPRPFPATLPEIVYSDDDQVRIVRRKGEVLFRGHRYFINEGLAGVPVGIRPTTTDGVFTVRYCQQEILTIDLQAATLDINGVYHVCAHPCTMCPVHTIRSSPTTAGPFAIARLGPGRRCRTWWSAGVRHTGLAPASPG